MTTSAGELLEAVRTFLDDELAPGLDGRARFEARIASNALAIVTRELALDPALRELDAAAAARWGLAAGEEESAVTLLARELRLGACSADAERLAYLRRRTLLRLAIDNPRYSSYLAACERWPELAPDGARSSAEEQE